MALSPSTVIETRPGVGNDLNGGAFVAGGAGSDYSQQNAAQYNGTDLTVHGSDNTRVAPDGHTPAAADLDNHIQITAGAGFTLGHYRITAQDGTYWTLDRSPAATSTSGGTWYLGGALATFGKLGKFLADHAVAGMLGWVKTGTDTLTNSTANTSGGPIALPTDTLLRIEGYNSTRGDLGAPPSLDAGTQTSLTLFGLAGTFGSKRQLVRNIRVDGNSQSGITGFGKVTGANYHQCRVHRCVAEACASYGYYSDEMVAEQCKALACNVGFRVVHAYRSYAKSCTSHGFQEMEHYARYLFCIASSNGGDGFHMADYGADFEGCIAWNNTNQGFYSQSYGMNHAHYCIAAANGAYGFNWANNDGILLACASYGNTSGRQTGVGLDLDAITLSSNPFVDAANDDFNINDTAGAGALLRAVELTLAP